jgi:hypothetical protein
MHAYMAWSRPLTLMQRMAHKYLFEKWARDIERWTGFPAFPPGLK